MKLYIKADTTSECQNTTKISEYNLQVLEESLQQIEEPEI